MAAKTKVYINYNILVNFDHPDGSTSCCYICYYTLVKIDSPDGSTYWRHKYYNNCDLMGQNQSHVAIFSYGVEYTSF